MVTFQWYKKMKQTNAKKKKKIIRKYINKYDTVTLWCTFYIVNKEICSLQNLLCFCNTALSYFNP